MAPRDRPVVASPSTMRKRGARKRLKFRAGDVCLERVTVADYANSDPAVVKSGRVKKAVANAVQQEVKSLCGLEASWVPADSCGSSDEMDSKDISDKVLSRKKKSKRHEENNDGVVGKDYPIDIWLMLASYIRPEDTVNFSLICKRAWTVTCTAAFWTRLYRRHYNRNSALPVRLQPESMEKMHCLRACVIRSLYHMYRPFVSRLARNPAIPETTPCTLKNSKCSFCRTLELLWCQQKFALKDIPAVWSSKPHCIQLKGRTANMWMTSLPLRRYSCLPRKKERDIRGMFCQTSDLVSALLVQKG